jgi:tRNA(Ile)-lysidine synthase
MPALQHDCSDSIVEQLSQLAQSARRYYKIVCKRADELWPDMSACDGDKSVLDMKLFGSEPLPVKVELIRRSLANINCGERYITQQHYENILQLAEHNVTGKKIVLPGGCEVLREYVNLIFLNHRVGLASLNNTVHPENLKIPVHTRFGGYLIQASISDCDENYMISEIENRKSKIFASGGVECFDLDKIKPPLYVRFRQAGDRFIPLGQIREKKLGKFLTAQRVPNEIRRNVLVVADREKIIWVWPVRISEESKISSETQRILQLQIIDLEVANRNGETNEQQD